MYDSLPRPLLSKSGFQGCIASLETNGELLVSIILLVSGFPGQLRAFTLTRVRLFSGSVYFGLKKFAQIQMLSTLRKQTKLPNAYSSYPPSQHHRCSIKKLPCRPGKKMCQGGSMSTLLITGEESNGLFNPKGDLYNAKRESHCSLPRGRVTPVCNI